MRVDITLHEVSDEYEETSLKNIEVPRLPRVGESVSLKLPERRVLGSVTLVGHQFYAPGVPTTAEADAWFVLTVTMSTDRQGNVRLRNEQGQVVTHPHTQHEGEQ
jgi:hypothetical protein